MKKQILLIARGLLLAVAVLPLANCEAPGSRAYVSPPAPMGEVSPAASKHRLETAPVPKTNRTGLATQAGRDTWSSLADIPFYRKRTGQPDAVDSFHYNDETGAKAMAEALGGGSKKSGSFSMAGGRVDVSLRPLWGSPYPRFEAAGRKIVVGDSGEAYQIFLTNRMKHAVEVVVSVDGLNVMDGRTASVTKTGYVIPAKGELSIKGFRKDRTQVKEFLFGAVDESAAARKGQARNVGVIGLAVYDEDEAQAQLARLVESQKRSAANPFGGQ